MTVAQATIGATREEETTPYLFLAAVFWVNVLAFFNMAAILVAMVKIAEALDASATMTLQLPTALYVAVACAAPVTPWLLRRLGARRLLLASIAGLAVTSLAAALCTSIWPLLVILFLHGLFSAPVSPATQAAVTQRLAESQRGVGMSVWGAGNYASYLIGPLLAGWLVDHVGWQAVPVIPLAITLIALPLVLLAMPRGTPEAASVDSATLVLAPLTVLLALAATSLGPALGWFHSPVVLACIAGTAAFLPLYAWRYARTPRPSFSLAGLGDRFAGMALLMVLLFNMFSTGLFQLEFIEQETKLGTAFIGLRTAVGGGALLLGFVIGGALIRSRRMTAALAGGLLVSVAGKVGFLFYDVDLDKLDALWPQIVVNVGFGMVTAALATLAYRTAPKDLAPHIATAFILAIYIGASLGSGVLDEVYLMFDRLGQGAGVTAESAEVSAFHSEFVVELVGVALLLVPAWLLLRRDRALSADQARGGANSERSSRPQ